MHFDNLISPSFLKSIYIYLPLGAAKRHLQATVKSKGRGGQLVGISTHDLAVDCGDVVNKRAISCQILHHFRVDLAAAVGAKIN